MGKLYDLAVKTGSYTDSQGQEKGRWLNIGSVMSGNDGGQFMIIDRTFSPAGLPNPDNRTSILVSMFEPKEGGGQSRQSAPASSTATPESKAPVAGGADSFVDDIPFN